MTTSLRKIGGCIVVLVVLLYCEGFSPPCDRATTTNGAEAGAYTVSALKSTKSVPAPVDEQAKISYRTAKPSDLSAIAMLLYSVFEETSSEPKDDQDVEELTPSETKNNDNTFLWDSLDENSDETQQQQQQQRQPLTPEEQLGYIEEQLARRMIHKDRQSSPHSFLVATFKDSVVGFLEMGTLPSPNASSSELEVPYIGNVAVCNTVRRRKVGSTLVRLATKIAQKWCPPVPHTKQPPIIFLSVERDNQPALQFYDRLGFQPLSLSSKSTTNKLYLAKEL